MDNKTIHKYFKHDKSSDKFETYVNKFLVSFKLLSEYERTRVAHFILLKDLHFANPDFMNEIDKNDFIYNYFEIIYNSNKNYTGKYNFKGDYKDVGCYVNYERGNKIFKVVKRNLNTLYDQNNVAYDDYYCKKSSLKELRDKKISKIVNNT